MYNFILQIVIVLSLGVIIYLIARTIPRTTNESEVGGLPDQGLPGQRPAGGFDKLVSKIPLAKIDAAIDSFLLKLLRKIKVLIMKVDNLLNIYLNKLRKNGQSKEPPQQ